MSSNLLYVSFDLVPAPKGASIHIEQFCNALANEFGSLLLVTIEMNSSSHSVSLENGIEHVRLPAAGKNLLDRVNHFRRYLELWWGERYCEIAHFRSPFEGLWLAQQKGKKIGALIFEVNGLPSIELKYRYPQIADDSVFLEKLIRQEDFCLAAADLIITPSEITLRYLQSRGVDLAKIKVIPNGVDLNVFKFSSLSSLHSETKCRMLYFGTLSAWQGVEMAVSLLADSGQERELELTVIGSGKPQQIEDLQRLAGKMGVEDRLRIVPTCTQRELVAHLHSSHLVLAPLSANDRNLKQGCCPFKIIEAMAAGRPVLSTSLPVVQEIAGDEPCIFTAKAGSLGSLRECLNEVLSSPERTIEYTRRARRRIEERYDLERTTRSLTESYESLLNTRLSKSLR